MSDPLTPSVDIHAEAAAQLLRGRVPLVVTGATEVALIVGLASPPWRSVPFFRR